MTRQKGNLCNRRWKRKRSKEVKTGFEESPERSTKPRALEWVFDTGVLERPGEIRDPWRSQQSYETRSFVGKYAILCFLRVHGMTPMGVHWARQGFIEKSNWERLWSVHRNRERRKLEQRIRRIREFTKQPRSFYVLALLSRVWYSFFTVS